MKYSYSYDPETDLWAIITPDGYTLSYEIFKRTAVIKVRKLNETQSSSSTQEGDMTIYSYYKSYSHWGQFKVFIITDDDLFFDGEHYYE